MLRVSTTSIEQYRRHMVYEYVHESAMIAKIRGIKIQPTWQMAAGSAFHACLEQYDDVMNAAMHADLLNVNPQKDVPLFTPEGEINHYTFVQKGAYVFNKQHLAKARDKIGHCLWEVKGNRIFDTSYGPCNVIAKADNVWGLRVQDTKCKFGSMPDGKDWESDLQWRFYLAVHGAEIFRYNAFAFREPKELAETPGVSKMEMIDWIGFNFFRYDAMEADCTSWIEEFLGWADHHHLLPYLHREPSE